LNFLGKLIVLFLAPLLSLVSFPLIPDVASVAATVVFRNVPGVTAAFIDFAIFYVAESFACALLLLSS
jgi:hypothetical protein